MEFTLKDKIRACHVTRWHGLRVARAQTLAEHLWAVTLFTRELVMRVMKDRYSEHELLLALSYAMLHDVPEVITGDMPTPAKVKIRQICSERGGFDPFELIEDDIFPELKDLKNQIQLTPIKYIVKLADILDAMSFIDLEGIGVGANNAKALTRKLFAEKLKEARAKFPNLDWDEAVKIKDELTVAE